MKQRVLIVGGAGYIGSHTNKLFSQNGYKTVVFDNLSTGHRRLARWGEFFKGDLANPADLARCFKKYRFSGVLLDETLEQVLNVIKLTAPINYLLDGKVVLLVSNAEQIENYSKHMKKNKN